MKTSARLAKILILLLIATLFLGMLFACDPGTNGEDPDNGNGNVTTVEKSVVLSNLADRLDTTISAVDSAQNTGGVVSLLSNYSFMAEDLKYKITYNVNYDYATPSGSRSDIYLKIYDEEYAKTRLMFYYTQGVLYVETEDGRQKITSFGNSGMFDIFYAFVSYFDMSTIIVDKTFASSVEDLAPYIESKKITQFATSDNSDNIALSNVNFDSKKATVNDLITSAFGRFGTTYDAIAKKLIGIEFSRLAGMQLMTLDANKVEFYSTDKVFNGTSFDFSGMLESKYEFSLVGDFSINTTRRDIEVDEWDDEDTLLDAIDAYVVKHNLTNEVREAYIKQYSYTASDISRSMFEGVVNLNMFGNTYDAEIFYNIDTDDDKKSDFSLRLLDQGAVVASAYYRQGSIYIDLADLYTSFNKAFGLADYNLPRVYNSTFSLRDAIDRGYETLDLLIRDLLTTSAEQRNGLWDIAQEKITVNGTITTLYVDKKLVTAINDLRDEPYTSANVVVFLADLIGIEKATLERYFTGEELDTLRLLISHDTRDNSIELKFQMTASEADAKSIISVDEAVRDNNLKGMYTQIGTVSPLSSKLTANGVDYYYYQYAGTLYSTPQRSVVRGRIRGDLNTLYLTLNGAQEVAYTFGTADMGIVELKQGDSVVGKYYTAQEYITIGTDTYYFTMDAIAPRELYSDATRTTVVNTLDYDKYMFKVENMYYYVGASAVNYVSGAIYAGKFDIFTQTFGIEGVTYNYGHGIAYKRGETVGVINAQNKIIIAGVTSSSFIQKITDSGKIGLYKEGDENQEIVGTYNVETRSITFDKGQFEGETFLVDVNNYLLKLYGTLDYQKKEVTMNYLGYTYNLNYGGVYSTEEGIDDVVTINLVSVPESRWLYSVAGSMANQLVDDKFYAVSIGEPATTYYFTLGDTRVFTTASLNNVYSNASVDYKRGTIIINNVEYLLGSALLNNSSNVNVGVIDMLDMVITTEQGVYSYLSDGTIIGLEKAGEYLGEGQYLLYTDGGEETFAVTGSILADNNGTPVGEIVDGRLTFYDYKGTFSGKEYTAINGELREIVGDVTFGSRTLMLNGTTYTYPDDSTVYVIRGDYHVGNKTIDLDGVSYYVENGKVYMDNTLTREVGIVDDATGRVVIMSQAYYYNQSDIEALRHGYKPVSYPEDLGFTFSGEITFSQVNSVDISSFLGTFIGDATGVNTECILYQGEKLTYQIKIAYHNNVPSAYILLERRANDENSTLIETLLSIVTAEDVQGDMLVDYYVMNDEHLRFRTTEEQILTALNAFAGEDSVFNTSSATSALYKIFEYADVSFMESGLAYSIAYDTATGTDPIKELVGLEYLSTNGIFTMDYDLTIPEVGIKNIDSALYNVPEIDLGGIKYATSIHDVDWIKQVDVKLGDTWFEDVTIPYIQETITIEDGKNVYTPTASLFGKTISYTLILTGENGTSEVANIGSIEIDPWSQDPLPDTISAYFDNGNIGEVRYTIVGFDDKLINEYGNAIWNSTLQVAEYPTYDVIVSQGSIGEVLFKDVQVKINSRILSDVKSTSGTTSILATTTIDPYDYDEQNSLGADHEMLLTSSANPEGLASAEERFFIRWLDGEKTLWSYIPIEFYHQYTHENHEIKAYENFYVRWDFDFSTITFRGSVEPKAKAVEIYAERYDEYGNKTYVQCATKDIAITVNVTSKLVDHLSLYNIETGVRENNGTYTVDSLKKETYTIPVRSTDKYMVLLYFSDGRFRVIGDPTVMELYLADGRIDGSLCDGVFNIALDWTYEVADYLAEYGTTTPLGGGSASVNTAVLSSGVIGSQDIKLTVSAPSRVVEITGTTTGYTKVDIIGNVVSRTESTFSYNTVSWDGQASGINKPFEINPYQFSTKPLPESITVAINEAQGSGQTSIKYLTYPIASWDESTNVVIKGDDGRYYLRYPTAEEANFLATLKIGDDRIQTEVNVIIKNKDAEYAYYEFEGLGKKPADEETVFNLDAYSPYNLPKSFSIYLEGEDEPLTYELGQFSWFVNYGLDSEKELVDGERYASKKDENANVYMLWSEEDYLAFRSFVTTGEGTFDDSWIDNRYYFFDNVTGNITLTAYIPSSVDGEELEQKLLLNVNVIEMTEYKLSTTLFASQREGNSIIDIDTYAQESATLLNYLEQGVLPLEMYSPATRESYTYYQKVSMTDIDSYNQLIGTLKTVGGAERDVTISDTTVLGNGTFSFTFNCLDRTVSSAKSMYFGALSNVSNDILTISYDISPDGTKSVEINLKKAYALTLINQGASVYALPSTFFGEALKTMTVAFSSSDPAPYATDIDRVIQEGVYANGQDSLSPFDESVLGFASGADSVVRFAVKIGVGSAMDYVNVTINTTADSATKVTTSYYVDVYNNDGIGGLKYPNGYTIPTDYVVTYNKSGVVTYTDLTWTLENSGQEIAVISADQLSNIAKSFNVQTTLPDGSIVRMAILLSNKNLKETNYNASTYHNGEVETATVTANKGVIAVQNIYELYDLMTNDGAKRVFDITKLPNVLVPVKGAGSEFVDSGSSSGKPIVFRVDWILSSFDPASLQEGTEYQIATATIKGYGQESQIVRLYVTVAKKQAVSITAEGYDFRYVDGKQYLYIDPYETTVIDGNSYYIWQRDLPTTATITLDDGTTYTFSGDSLAYTSANGALTKLIYDYQHFTDTASATKDITLTLEDGSTIAIEAVIIDRTYKSVQLPYVAKDDSTQYFDSVYYVDPYNSDTYTVPNTVDIVFNNGESTVLTLNWVKYADSARLERVDDIEVRYNGMTSKGTQAVYYYRATLAAYRYVGDVLTAIDDNNNQHVDVIVTVLDRSIASTTILDRANVTAQGIGDVLRIDRTFSVVNGEDHIGMRLTDVYPEELNQDSFNQDALPADFRNNYSNMRLAYPTINWTGATDSDIKDGMTGDSALVGHLYNAEVGQEVNAYIVTDRLTLASSFNGASKLNSVAVEFNRYTGDSIYSSYDFTFSVEIWNGSAWVASEDESITFYTEATGMGDSLKSRHLINWEINLAELGNTNDSQFWLYNGTKDKDSGYNNLNNHITFITVDALSDLVYVRLDLGLGDTDNTDGTAQFVIDPLQPYLPTSVDSAEGFFGMGTVKDNQESLLSQGYSIVGDKYGLWLPLGAVTITWLDGNLNGVIDAFDNMTHLNSNDARTVNATVAPVNSSTSIAFNFDMYYLNRKAEVIYTDRTDANIGFGTTTGAPIGWTIISNGVSINPINNYEKYGSYQLMSMLRLIFENPYSNSDLAQSLLYKAFEYYGDTIDVINLDMSSYYLGGGSISLQGTVDPLTASLISGTVVGKDGKQYNVSIEQGVYTFELTVDNCAVTASNISTNYNPATKTFTVENPVDNSIDYSIDPYNVSLPDNLIIYMGSGQSYKAQPCAFVRLDNGSYAFADGTGNRLNDYNVIHDKGVSAQERSVTAYVSICGEEYYFVFSIKTRAISIDPETQQTKIANDNRLHIDGGNIYIRASSQAEAVAQLPAYMYYDFGGGDYARVPLTYNATDITSITKLGSWQVKAELGVTETPGITTNIVFTVIVVDSKLYEIRTITDAFGNVQETTMYDLVYDKIIASISSSNVRLEDMDGMWTPQYITLGDGNNLAIERVEYDLDKALATFYCQYQFQEDTYNSMLAGDADGNKYFTFALVVPLIVNSIDDFVGQAELDKSEVRFAIGQEISLTDLPQVTYNGVSYAVFWDVTGRLGGDRVDIYRADTYHIYGEVLNGLREVVRFGLDVIIEKTDISSVATYTLNDLKYEYTGQAKGYWEDRVAFPGVTFLDTAGNQYMPELTIEFSNDGINWMETEFVNVGKYYVRVSVDDDNVTGSRVFEIEITRATISGNLITFANTTQTYSGAPLQPTVLYDGQPLPSHVKYSFTFYRYQNDVLVESTQAINATSDNNLYNAVIVFEENNNYNFSSINNLSTSFTIEKKRVSFQLATEKTYSGSYEHIAIDGLPNTYAMEGVEVYYTYTYTVGSQTYTTSNPVKDVGTYKVSVTIVGGNNYYGQTLSRDKYEIKPAIITVIVDGITCTYPAVVPVTPTVTYVGKQGADASMTDESLFGPLKITCEATNYVIPVPGIYPLEIKEEHRQYNKNYTIVYQCGDYVVNLPEGYTLLDSNTTLQEAIDNYQGSNLRLYLKEGDYSNITINKQGLTVSLIGECKMDGTYGAEFENITLINGSLELSAIGFRGAQNTISLVVKNTAQSVIMTKVGFYGETYQSETALSGSIGVEVEAGYDATLSMTDVHVKYRTMGMSVYSGRIVVENSSITYTASGIAVHGGNVSMVRSRITHATVYGLYLASASLVDNYQFISNSFTDNVVAIRYISTLPLMSDASVVSGNEFRRNQTNFVAQQ